ncbi:hypothetical protein AX17_005287 [Amanita inopinata Kibby_2008]|nr:hypothetical protein AX17_005287 [Amanita inopinata Kibby_2008]
MSSALRRTKARALTFSRSVANAFKLTIATADKPNKSVADPRPNGVQPSLTISRPMRLKRVALPVFERVHLIHLMPFELLAHIFILGSEADPMFPIIVSQVCRKWRRLALHTPALWRRITLDHRLDMWVERLRRAKACPLDIQLVPWFTPRQCRRRSRRPDMATVQWYMHIVTPHMRRWRSLEIIFKEHSPYLWNAALSGCCASSMIVQAPLLEELTLLYRANDDTKEFYLFSGYAPRLRRVTLDGIKLTWMPSLFGNLTFLDYTHHGFNQGYHATREVTDMLRACPYLIELRILFPQKRSVRYHSRPGRLELPHVVLTRLVDFQIRVEGEDIPFELAHVASLLQTPALQRLYLMDHKQRGHPLPSVKVFFCMYNVPETLHTLCIEYGWYDSSTLSSLLRASFIQHLVLKRRNLPKQVMHFAAKHRNRSRACPWIP